jgi:hypothetical protein
MAIQDALARGDDLWRLNENGRLALTSNADPIDATTAATLAFELQHLGAVRRGETV